MEMPDVIYAFPEKEYCGVFICAWSHINPTQVSKEITEYHHSRIVEALKDKLSETVIHLAARNSEIEGLKDRLEIDQSQPYDGIYARDETIKMLEHEVSNLKAKLDKANVATDELAESLRFCVKKIEKINGECNATYISKEKLKKYAPEQR